MAQEPTSWAGAADLSGASCVHCVAPPLICRKIRASRRLRGAVPAGAPRAAMGESLGVRIARTASRRGRGVGAGGGAASIFPFTTESLPATRPDTPMRLRDCQRRIGKKHDTGGFMEPSPGRLALGRGGRAPREGAAGTPRWQGDTCLPPRRGKPWTQTEGITRALPLVEGAASETGEPTPRWGVPLLQAFLLFVLSCLSPPAVDAGS